ncbi:MAG: DUF3419 family protein [Bacilli bacterium]|nr:DUF3419 family protein [Bacilli bacterium]
MTQNVVSLAQQIVSGKRFNFGGAVAFHSESIIYKKSNERLEEYQHHLENKNKMLSVIASGDQILNSILGGTKEVDAFDISVFPKYFLFLKIGAIKALNRDEFLEFFYGDLDYSEKFDDIYDKIRLCLEPKVKEFWDGLFNFFDWYDIYNSTLFSSEPATISDVLNQNKYLEEDNFYKLKLVIDDVVIKTIEGDIFEIVDNFKGKYDLVYLSNILFYSDYNKYKKLLDGLILSDNGIVLTYLHHTPDSVRDFFGSKNVSFEDYEPYGGMMVYRK